MFRIEHTSTSSKFLNKCDNTIRERIMKRIEILKTDPVSHDTKRLIGEIRSFRIRVGDYRILYKIKWEEKIILIARIDKRSKVYS